jgi:hypothetical protein
MVGLYETAIDELCTRHVANGVDVKPKIVASTATVRRAKPQIRALFGREQVSVFPPPGPDARDSFFAETVDVSTTPGRLYLGVAAPGQSLKVALLRTYITLLSAAQKLYDDAGGKKLGKGNPADPYMTLLGYFSSLRELGGSRRIIEDEVKSRLAGYHKRNRGADLFAKRAISDEVVELTSRVSMDDVATARRRLDLPASEEQHVDVAVATNMISVGLDIPRLGLMVVLGQPVTTAEYIQASSRVGREDDKPGLVVTIFNVYRPRDRSHYERFELFHAAFYRDVEASSVTPFSPRALDRGLPGVVVALGRHAQPAMAAPASAGKIVANETAVANVPDVLASRAAAHDDLDAADSAELKKTVHDRAKSLLDAWKVVAGEKDRGLQYNGFETRGLPGLLFTPLDPELQQQSKWGRQFHANRSLRDVEQTVKLWMKIPGTAEADALFMPRSEEDDE